MKKKKEYPYTITKGGFMLFIFSILLCGCHGTRTSNLSSGKEEVLEVQDNNTQEVFPILVTLKEPDHQNRQYPLDIVFKLSDKNEYISIDPISDYYNSYVSKKRFSVPIVPSMHTEEVVEWNVYPQIECFIINNSNETLNINEMNINVTSSKIDPLPYIYIATEGSYCNCMVFMNESWFNWGEARLDYKILRKGEQFDGRYSKTKEIPYFSDICRINFLQDLISMGYDYEALFQMTGKSHSDEDDDIGIWIEEDQYNTFKGLFEPFEIETDSFNDEYYAGFARIYGKLTFIDSNYSVEFQGKILLSCAGEFGGGMEEDDSYDVKLKTKGTNYILKYPYVTSIAPRGSERIGMTLMCPKSTLHTFSIEAINNNDIKLKSKEIRMHYLNPKHSSMNIWQIKKKHYD